MFRIQQRRTSAFTGGGGATTYDGFKVKMAHANWIGLYEIRMTDQDSSEFCDALTALTETAATTYAAVSAGEIATDSTYGADATRARIVDTQPDISDSADSPGSVEWSTSSGSGIEIYVKPSTDRTIKYVDICIATNYGDPISGVSLTDGSDNVITIVSAPADINDVYQTTSVATAKWFRWEF